MISFIIGNDLIGCRNTIYFNKKNILSINKLELYIKQEI